MIEARDIGKLPLWAQERIQIAEAGLRACHYEASLQARQAALYPELVAACEAALKLIEAAEKQGILSSTHAGVGWTRATLQAVLAKVKELEKEA